MDRIKKLKKITGQGLIEGDIFNACYEFLSKIASPTPRVTQANPTDTHVTVIQTKYEDIHTI
jgi:hypothetical protein